jgi:hypothetical protein
MITVNGIELRTTFWKDFSSAESFGKKAIQETYERSMHDWGENVEFAKELVLVLNHKIWQHFGKDNVLARLYNQLWDEAHGKCLNFFSQPGKERELFEYLNFLD